MSKLTIADLPQDIELDRAAMKSIAGRGLGGACAARTSSLYAGQAPRRKNTFPAPDAPTARPVRKP